jgi:DNA-binding NtrC family response regulator
LRIVARPSRSPNCVRLIAITHTDLAAAANSGGFDTELLSRLGAVSLDVPPLRSRGADILRMAERFVARYSRQIGKSVSGISPDVADQLNAYAWPPPAESADALEQRYVLKVVEAVEGDEADAASLLALSRTTLRAKLRGYRAH